MFGLLISGRLVDTSFREVDQTHCVIDIPDSGVFNHVAVFLTGQQPFPDGAGGAVYFCWPSVSPDQLPNWHYMGMLSNQKPSAIFKVGRLRSQAAEGSSREQEMASRFQGMGQPIVPNLLTAQLGISIEPLSVLAGLAPATDSEAANVPIFVEFSNKLVENLINFVSSFSMSSEELRMKLNSSCMVGQGGMAGQNEAYVPLRCLQQWYTNVQRRLQQNPLYWR